MSKRPAERAHRPATPTSAEQSAALITRPFAPQSHSQLANGTPVQTKLTVTAAGDQYEQEADQVADQVLAQEGVAPAAADVAPAEGSALVQLDAEAGAVDAGGGAVPQAAEQSIEAARGGGSPLPAELRTSLEGAFGHDFSQVRVHADATAASLSESLSAQAFTTGADIFFREGAYQPEAAEGRRLLAHELTHVVQQEGGAEVQRQLVQRNDAEQAAAKKEDEEAPEGKEKGDGAPPVTDSGSSSSTSSDAGATSGVPGVASSASNLPSWYKRSAALPARVTSSAPNVPARKKNPS